MNLDDYSGMERVILVKWHKLCMMQIIMTQSDLNIHVQTINDALKEIEQANESLIIRYVNDNPHLKPSVWSISKDKFK
jgi:hypothetical protein